MKNAAQLIVGLLFRWKLWRPMLFVSVAVHAMLLALPLPSEPESTESEVPEETVKITSLVAPEPAPEPSATPPTPQAAQPPAPAAPPIPQLDRVPLEEAIPEALPEESASEEAIPEALPEESASEEAIPEALPEESASEELPSKQAAAPPGANLVEALRPRILERLAKSSNDLPEMENFLDSFPTESMNAEQTASFFEGNQLKEGAVGSVAIPQTNTVGAYTDYLEPVLTKQLGFNLEPLDQLYGGADLYRAQNAEGVEFYMSLVKLKLGSGAFVVFWQGDPRTSTN